MEPDDFETRVRDIAQAVHDANSTTDQFAVSQTPFHTHNNSDSPSVAFPDLSNRSRFIVLRALSATSPNVVASNVWGNFVFPFTGNFITAFAYVDTAGITGTESIDVFLNGISIFPSTMKLSILTTATLSNTAIYFANQNFNAGDILTINVTGVQTTPALGLTLELRVTETSK